MVPLPAIVFDVPFKVMREAALAVKVPLTVKLPDAEKFALVLMVPVIKQL